MYSPGGLVVVRQTGGCSTTFAFFGLWCGVFPFYIDVDAPTAVSPECFTLLYFSHPKGPLVPSKDVLGGEQHGPKYILQYSGSGTLTAYIPIVR